MKAIMAIASTNTAIDNIRTCAGSGPEDSILEASGVTGGA
jgi:hypothetical protein